MSVPRRHATEHDHATGDRPGGGALERLTRACGKPDPGPDSSALGCPRRKDDTRPVLGLSELSYALPLPDTAPHNVEGQDDQSNYREDEGKSL